jgi:hypothetical protein
MIRTATRRALTIVGVAGALTVSGLPFVTGTALAAVTVSPDTAPNSGTVTLTLTGGATMFAATGATLVNHNNPSVTIPDSGFSSPTLAKPTQRMATFNLLNKLPGNYDINIAEPTGSDSCTSCFTITGVGASISLTMPSTIAVGSAGTGLVTVTNPPRGYDYPKTNVRLVFSGVPNLTMSQLTLEVNYSGTTFTQVPLQNQDGDVVGFLGPSGGTHVAPNTTLSFPLRLTVNTGTQPNSTLSTNATFGDVNTTTGGLADSLASADRNTKITTQGSTYTPMAPVRILDTRVGTGHVGALGPGASLTLAIGGSYTVPPTATAVAINLTATGATASGFLEAYPAGAQNPNASNVNYLASGSAANFAVVPLGASNAITITNGGAGSVQVVADVEGYYDTGGLTFGPLNPVRIVDSRTSSGPIPAHGTRSVTVTGVGGVPASGVKAVAVNVTVTAPQSQGFLNVFPSGATEPATSNVNFNAGQTIANLVLVPVSSAGQITIANHSTGTVQFIVDVQGYFSASSSGSSLHPTTITRVLDTRVDGTKMPIPANSAINITLGGKATIPTTGVTMIAVNLTVTAPTRSGFIVAYQQGAARPATSNANFVAGQTIANLAYVKVTDGGGLTVFNASSGTVHLVVDVQGWGSSP